MSVLSELKFWSFLGACLDKQEIFIGRTDAEAETPILWPPDEKN